MKLFPRNDGGFSLVETLVATFIFALVSASAVAILSGFESNRIRLQDASSQLAALDQTRAIMRADFFAAHNRPVRDEFGSTIVAFESGVHMPEGALLRLVRGGNPTAALFGNMSTLQRIDYVLVGGSIYRRIFDRTDIVIAADFIDQKLMSDVQSISLRYATNGIWVEEWGTLAADFDLPRLAEVSITFGSGQDVKMMFLVGTKA